MIMGNSSCKVFYGDHHDHDPSSYENASKGSHVNRPWWRIGSTRPETPPLANR